MINRKTIASRRRENLRAWIDERALTTADVSRLLDVGRAYVHLLFNPDRFFGERAARKIEQKLGMSDGALDADPAAPPGPVQTWEMVADVRPPGAYVMVPVVVVEPPAGVALAGADPGVIPPLPFKASWLAAAGVTARSALRFARMPDDSMARYIGAGDLMLIDTSQAEVIDGRVYAIVYGGSVRVRRLSRRFDGGLIVKPESQSYPEDVLTAADAGHIKVLGRMIWRGG